MRARFLIAVVAVLAGPCHVLAATVHVPADQPTIQSGVNAATDGDTSLVAPEQSMGRSISDFVTPDGRIDFEAARSSGYEGPLNLDGAGVQFDPRTGAPRVRQSAAFTPTDDPDDIYWDNRISPSVPGVDGDFRAVTVYDGQLVVGGGFQVAGDVITKCIAAWDGTSCSPLGSGMNGSVSTLTVYDGKLIAGGSFSTAGGVAASGIASWNGSSWSPLGSGMNGSVSALTVYDGKLIAGGGFTTAGGVAANRIASWNGSSWSPLASGRDHQ